MKKMFLIILMLMCGLVTLNAEVFTVGSFSCALLDDEDDEDYREIIILCDDEKNVYSISLELGSDWYALFFTSEHLEKFIGNLQKGLSWSKIAKETKTSILKEVPDSRIDVAGAKRINNKTYTSKTLIPLGFIFFSKMGEIEGPPILVIESGTALSNESDFTTVEFKSFALTPEQIEELISVLSSDSVKAAKKKYELQKSANDMFM